MAFYGTSLLHGLGVDRNYEEAFDMYNRGSIAGNSDCLNSKGRMLLNGSPDGKIEPNKQQAFDCFLESAEKGFGPAMLNLAKWFHDHKDLENAKLWNSKASKFIDLNQFEHELKALKH